MIYEYERSPFYYETDQMGIVHHSNYIRWFEEARICFMDAMGYSYKRLEDEKVIIPVLGVNVDYKKMVRFGDTVIIKVKISQYDGVRLACEYEVVDKATGYICTIGSSKHCFLNEKGRPASLKRINAEAHEAFSKVLESE